MSQITPKNYTINFAYGMSEEDQDKWEKAGFKTPNMLESIISKAGDLWEEERKQLKKLNSEKEANEQSIIELTAAVKRFKRSAAAYKGQCAKYRKEIWLLKECINNLERDLEE